MPTFLSANLDTSWFTPADNRNLVPRLRLLDALQAHSDAKVRALLAPIGGGKTTLLQQYYSLYPQRTAWLGLQQADSSATCFFHHLSVALKRIVPEMNGPILCHEFSDYNLKPFLLLDLFYEALSKLDDTITVIIDDVQIIRNTTWHPQFLELIQNSPNIHWIIAGTSRTALFGEQEPDDSTFLITQDSLYFRPNELRVFLSKNAAHQAFNELVIKTTHGWPAGVKLAQLCLSNFAAEIHELNLPSRELFNFLVDRLLDHLDKKTGGFLTQTAFLHRFNEALCQSYVKGGQVANSLQLLRDTRLLLDIDPEHPLCFRYSPLVQERLILRFQALEESERERLVSSACNWLSDNSYHVEGVRTANYHPQSRVQAEYYLKNLVYWLRSGNLQTLYQDHVSNENTLMRSLPQARMAWCWLLNLSGRLKESALELTNLAGKRTIEEIIKSPGNHTEVNCAVAYGIILSQQKRLSKELVENLKQLTKHPEVYTSLRSTLYTLLAEVELHHFHAREAQHYISLSRETSDELDYEFNNAIAQQIEARLYYFNSDPQQALESACSALNRNWQHPSAIGKSLATINYGYFLYRVDNREEGYQICLSESASLLPWMHADTQFMAYQVIVREAIRQNNVPLANHLLEFISKVSASSGSDRYYAQTTLERFRLAIINNDRTGARFLAEECFLNRRLSECMESNSDLDWITQLSWLMSGVFYHRLSGEWNLARSLVQKLFYLNIESGFSIHFLHISLLELWLEFESGNKNAAFIKLNDLISKTSSKDLHLGLFDDIPGSEKIIHKGLVENRITNPTHRSALLELGYGVVDH